ncbi:MAG: glycosyltransferase family 2 protein [Acidobacteriaceae bacterium]|nr:glycosyltransferase family 2 protein [Acidobacteriaceae bacterium]MBV9499628.1 glycosyltransferase family 2 protein [Acidobacteriaceae bacterium]
MKISATIITFNEERNISRVIESLRCCDEILVLDSGSNDRTVEIASNLGARVVEASWHGYATQKNMAMELAANDWIFSIDADESLSEALEAEIWQIKKAGPKFDGYTVPRLAQYMGRWIMHSGWYPDRKIRLFNKQRATWVGEFVHETVKITGSIGHLNSNLLHFTCDSLSQHVRTMDSYTTLAAQEIAAREKNVPLSKLLFDPPWTFFQTYVLKLGFLDGVEGLTIAYMAAFYNYVKYAKARHMSPGRKF